MKSIKLFALWFLALSSTAFNEIKPIRVIRVSGIVTDAKNGEGIKDVLVVVKGTTKGTVTNELGSYDLDVPNKYATLIFSHSGYQKKEITVGSRNTINIQLIGKPIHLESEAEMAEEDAMPLSIGAQSRKSAKSDAFGAGAYSKTQYPAFRSEPGVVHNTEEYDIIRETGFLESINNPLSTFSIDVDAASYSNLRRVINNGGRPTKDMARIEEMVNYFTYEYKNPTGEHPFSITTEVSNAPWNEKHRLVHIGLQGKKLDYENLQPNNLVFLIDASGL